MPSHFLLTSRFPVKKGFANEITSDMTESHSNRVFVSMDEDEVLELRAFESPVSLESLDAMLMPEASRLSKYLAGDVRRELLSFVEAPKGCKSLLPETVFIQLRHVEVKPDKMVEYRKWRDRTIFEVVRRHAAAEVFLAYHSLISGQPGVMFVAGFSSSPDKYTAAFSSDHYTEIVRQAGDTYITGGSAGLYTKIYRSLAAPAV